MSWLRVLSIVILIGSFPAPVRGSDPASPLGWIEVDRATAIADSTALRLAQEYLGRMIQPASHRLVAITDRDNLGDPVRDRIAYLTLFRSVTFERVYEDKPDSIHVDLYVAVDGETGRLLLAFTPAREVWVDRERQRRDPDEQASLAKWTLAPPPAEGMSSTVTDVLQAVFEKFGRKHVDAGQTVVRPRWVRTMFPARAIEGQYVPIRKPGPTWVVHTMGEILLTRGPPPVLDEKSGTLTLTDPWHCTEVLMLVDDATLEVWPSAFMP